MSSRKERLPKRPVLSVPVKRDLTRIERQRQEQIKAFSASLQKLADTHAGDLIVMGHLLAWERCQDDRERMAYIRRFSKMVRTQEEVISAVNSFFTQIGEWLEKLGYTYEGVTLRSKSAPSENVS